MSEHLREMWRRVAYQGQHAPPSDGPPLHDLLAPHPDGGKLYPDDVYTHPHYYTFGDHAAESTRVIQQVRGNPDAPVTIYRSLPPLAEPMFNTGDWVAIARGYAAEHGFDRGWDEWVEPKVPDVFDEGEGWVRREGDWPVMSAIVPAHTVRNGGNDLIEWGYHGPPIPGRVG